MIIRYLAVLAACGTLGLAPLLPEPHLVGKVRWVAGGAVGMGLVDWGDLALHGAPWVVLIGMGAFDLARAVLARLNPKGANPAGPSADEM